MIPKRERGVIPELSESQVLEFWENVKKAGDEECWVWQGHRNTGYGVVFWKSNQYYAHRIAYALSHGSIPKDLTIDHVRERGCLSKLCVNPAHLETVTQSENIKRYHRSRKLDPAYNPAKCRHGHDREIGKPCRTCAAAAVARSQAKKPMKYRLMKRRNKQAQRERDKIRNAEWMKS